MGLSGESYQGRLQAKAFIGPNEDRAMGVAKRKLGIKWVSIDGQLPDFGTCLHRERVGGVE